MRLGGSLKVDLRMEVYSVSRSGGIEGVAGLLRVCVRSKFLFIRGNGGEGGSSIGGIIGDNLWK